MDLKFILEAILFSAQKPMSSKELRDLLSTAGSAEGCAEEAKAFRRAKDDEVLGALEELQRDHEAAQRSYRLACIAGAWQFVSQPEFAPWLVAMHGQKNRPARLSQPALETLAIIAYRQPCTRAEIEQVRGVAVDGVMQTLLERGLVEQVGRAEVVGRPMTYGTTAQFLEYFGLPNLDGLPAADELRRIPVTKPEALVTAEPAPAAATTEQLSLAEAEKLAAADAQTEQSASTEQTSVAENPESTAGEQPAESAPAAESGPEASVEAASTTGADTPAEQASESASPSASAGETESPSKNE